MEALEVAKSIAKPFEGLRLAPYLCPGGVLTIFRGHAIRNGETFPERSVEEADRVFNKDMIIAVKRTLKQCPGLINSPKRLGAISDFVFNLGSGRLQASTLRRRINQGNWYEARREISKWVFASGRKLNGLVLRRAAEAKFI